MHTYALIFRASRPVDAADLETRNSAARDWAMALRRQGLLNAASPLEDQGTVVTEHGVGPVPTSDAIASVLIIRAGSHEEAVRLAQGHPGLIYGTKIEVRPVKVVPPAH